jgi:hypothetical protein
MKVGMRSRSKVKHFVLKIVFTSFIVMNIFSIDSTTSYFNSFYYIYQISTNILNKSRNFGGIVVKELQKKAK